MPKKNNLSLFIFGILLIALTACSAQAIDPNEPTIQGRPVSSYYVDSCSGCHGPTRQGGTGPALLPQRLTQSDEYYFDIIQNGKPNTVMPPWGAMMSDEDINTMIAFLHDESAEIKSTWELEDIQDSFEIIIPENELPTTPSHESDLGNLMLVTEREVQSIAVIDGDTHELISHIAASYRAHGYAFDPTNERWAYNMGRDGWVFKIDLYSLQPVRKVRVGLDSRGIAISDDGRYLITGNYIPATAVILDAQTLEPIKVISAHTTNPEGEEVDSRICIVSDVSPDLVGSYFILGLKEAGQMWRVDWSDPEFPIERVENVGHILHDGFLSPDNTRFYIASQDDNWMGVIDVENWELVEQIETGIKPHPGSGATWEVDGVEYGATVHAGEGKISIWNLANNEIVGTVETAGAGLFIRSSHNSPYGWADAVFAAEPHSITVFEKSPPFEVVGLIEDGERTLHPEFTADGAYVYISDWDGNVVRVYDAVSLELVAEIEGVETPTGIFNTSRRSETLGH